MASARTGTRRRSSRACPTLPGGRWQTFTPHLVPMNRGILATIYVHLRPGAQPTDLQAELERRYADEPFVRVLPFQSLPATRHVRGANLCLIAVHPDGCPAARSCSRSSTIWSRAPPAKRCRT